MAHGRLNHVKQKDQYLLVCHFHVEWREQRLGHVYELLITVLHLLIPTLQTLAHMLPSSI